MDFFKRGLFSLFMHSVGVVDLLIINRRLDIDDCTDFFRLSVILDHCPSKCNFSS